MSTQTLFQIPVRIYWEDTDASGVVYHANYARYFERARTDWLRQRGIDQTRLAESLGVLVVVRHLALDLLAPARLDDLCQASVEIEQVKRVSVMLRQELRRAADDALLVYAQITLACLDATSFRPAAFPATIRALLAEPAREVEAVS